MNEPIDRLRRADPAAGLLGPDARAESDLRLLLESPRVDAPPPVAPVRPRAPVLVTALVAIVVVALTTAVLGLVRPRTDVGGLAPTASAFLPADGCRPAQVLPFQCGTYESTYGGAKVTGAHGGPAEDRLSVSFTQQHGALLLSARTTRCFAEQVLVRFDGTRLVRAGTPRYSKNGCAGRGPDRTTWAYDFLRGPLVTADGETYSLHDSASSVFFEFQGAAPLGARQLPRTDLTCRPAHVAPFSCDTYLSTGGTGALAFLGTDLFRLGFAHVNGQLTAGLYGRCNALSAVLEPDGGTVVALGGGTTQMLCEGAPGAQDAAVSRFFAGTLAVTRTEDTLEFRSGTASATFTRRLAACVPASSPFCGTYRSTGGSGSVARLASSGTRLRFGEARSSLTATVDLLCGSRTYRVTIDRGALRFRPLTTSARSCPAGAGAKDAAVDAFLRGGLTWRIQEGRLELDRSASGRFASVDFAR